MARMYLRKQLRWSSHGQTHLTWGVVFAETLRKLKERHGLWGTQLLGWLTGHPARVACARQISHAQCHIPTVPHGQGKKANPHTPEVQPSRRGFGGSGEQGLIGRAAQPKRSRGQEVLDPGATGAFGGVLGCLWEVPGYGSPSYVTLFPPQAMTGLEQPLKHLLHFYTAGKRMMPAACTGARVPLCWKAPSCFLRSCGSAGRDCRPVPELPEAEASPLCSRDTVSPTLSRRGQSWHGCLDNGGTRHQARLGAQRARRRSWPCM